MTPTHPSYDMGTKDIIWDLRFSWRWLWRTLSSGMWYRMALVRRDVSEKFIAFIFSVTRTCSLETTLIVTSNGNTLRRTPCLWRRHVPPKDRILQVIRRHIPEDGILQSYLQSTDLCSTQDCSLRKTRIALLFMWPWTWRWNFMKDLPELCAWHRHLLDNFFPQISYRLFRTKR
jgi:hypothetical protein